VGGIRGLPVGANDQTYWTGAQARCGWPSFTAGLNRHLDSAKRAASSSDKSPLDFRITDWATLPSVSIRKRIVVVPCEPRRRASFGYSGLAHVTFFWAVVVLAIAVLPRVTVPASAPGACAQPARLDIVEIRARPRRAIAQFDLKRRFAKTTARSIRNITLLSVWSASGRTPPVGAA